MKKPISPIIIMQLGIKFNKLSDEIRKITCESFKIEYTENKIEINQKFINKLYELDENNIKKRNYKEYIQESNINDEDK